MVFTLTSPEFIQDGEIPARYTCDGAGVSPPLTWADVPSGTKSLALIVDDPDAPDPQAPQRTWVHWVVYNLPPAVAGLAEGAASEGLLPKGAIPGLNDWKRASYGGPCPPIGRHRYFHKLYALDVVLPNLGAAIKAQIEQTMKDHVLAQAQLVGTYERDH